jgi:hypothetical protein
MIHNVLPTIYKFLMSPFIYYVYLKINDMEFTTDFIIPQVFSFLPHLLSLAYPSPYNTGNRLRKSSEDIPLKSSPPLNSLYIFSISFKFLFIRSLPVFP